MSIRCSAHSTPWRTFRSMLWRRPAASLRPNELATPQNAIVLNYAAHDPIIRRAALVMTHGGHGTAMRSLLHGVPMVIVPGLAGGPAIRRRGRAGMGRRSRTGWQCHGPRRCAMLPGKCLPPLRSVTMPSAVPRRLAGVNGAANAADQVEALLQPSAARDLPRSRGFESRIDCHRVHEAAG